MTIVCSVSLQVPGSNRYHWADDAQLCMVICILTLVFCYLRQRRASPSSPRKRRRSVREKYQTKCDQYGMAGFWHRKAWLKVSMAEAKSAEFEATHVAIYITFFYIRGRMPKLLSASFSLAVWISSHDIICRYQRIIVIYRGLCTQKSTEIPMSFSILSSEKC